MDGQSQETDLLIIGAGIAGASAAFFAARAGRRVMVVDAGTDCASLLPRALINPVRGYQGRIAPRGLEGARFTLDLIDALVIDGHRIAHGRGLWRPVPDARTRARWDEQLPQDLPHAWHDEIPEALGLAGSWAGVLHLPESGWVDADAFVRALLAASGCEFIRDEVRALQPHSTSRAVHYTAVLADGTHLAARSVLWCGGAWGAARQGWKATYRPGSVIVTDTPVAEAALSHGLYAAPLSDGPLRGSVIGPTHEAMTNDYPSTGSDAAGAALQSMSARAHGMFHTSFRVARVWRGVRLDSVSVPQLAAAPLPALTGFGSRGFLMAPLLAHEWVGRK